MDHSYYMSRCIQLAQLGWSRVAPNPMVGALLVHENRIIGEGYHQEYGGPHAEVNCLDSVKEEDAQYIPYSTLYVSLEPCAHFGKTPPCADLIIQYRIPEVVIGSRDPFPEVNGKGLEKLQSAGIRIKLGILEDHCKFLNRKFFTYHRLHRPFITLKWAQTADKKIARDHKDRLYISNAFTNRMVHRERSSHMAILIGTNTALMDDPGLTTRYWTGPSPLRLVIDKELRLPSSLKLFNGDHPTVVFNLLQHTLPESRINFRTTKDVYYYQVAEDASLVHQILHALYTLNIQSLLIEGGAYLLQSFIDEGLWDEAIIITNESMNAEDGLPAPELKDHTWLKKENYLTDRIDHYVQQMHAS